MLKDHKKLIVILLLFFAVNLSAEVVVLTSFNSGELSPLLEGRIDVQKYYSGCAELENMVVLPHGGVTKRPGTRFITKAKSSSLTAVLFPFEFSTTQAYIIEVGNLYLRFYKDGGQILSGGIPYEIESPYLTADLFELEFIQSADIMYIVHNNYAPRALTRTDHDAWTLTAITFERGPFNAENETTTTINPSAATGSITLTASTAIFNANHVGALWQITHTTPSVEVSGSFTSVANSSTLTMQLDRAFDLTTHGTWTGTVLLQRSFDSGSTWKDVFPFHSENDGNITFGDSEIVADAIYRVRMDSYSSGICNFNLVARSADIDGVVTITAFTNTSLVTGTVTNTLGGTTAVTTWAEGSWSADEGYPGAIAFFDERQVYAATNQSPQTIWMSQTDDWDNFLAGSLDTSAVTINIASDNVNSIQWLTSQTALLVGTVGGEWVISASSDAEAITPSNVGAKRQSGYGSAHIQPVVVNNNVLFVQQQARKIRNMVFAFETDSWISPDLSILSEHITESGILQIAMQRSPYSILWCVRNDGEVAALTLEEDNQVIGWHRHNFGGTVESCAVISGTTEDEVWFLVNRTIRGATKRYIEQLQVFDWGSDQKDVFFVDSGLSFEGEGTQTINGVTQADPAVITIVGHTFSDGDQIRVTDVEGMTELNDTVFSVGTTSTNSFELRDFSDTVDITSVGFTAYTSGGSAIQVENTFGGLDHLNGETVDVVGNGGYVINTTVSSGIVTIEDYFNVVHIGLPFTSKLRPVRLEASGSGGVLFSTNKRITEVAIRFNETLACDIGISWDDYDSFIFRDADDMLETVTPLFSGDKRIDFDGDYETDGYLYIQSRIPVPFTVLGLKAELEVYP